jgi:hypothetical protein
MGVVVFVLSLDDFPGVVNAAKFIYFSTTSGCDKLITKIDNSSNKYPLE